ncbi:MAG TPA: hypothetical protein VGQ11_10550 [Candidatus Acidoferrales bacterium]|jgi:hypothetical protein|nr:hypothetical protein [Candidatus Acidoferrales bacterium]
MKTAKKKRTPSRLRAAQPADLRPFYGILSREEAGQMIRDIEEAFEHLDAE